MLGLDHISVIILFKKHLTVDSFNLYIGLPQQILKGFDSIWYYQKYYKFKFINR